MAVLDTTGNGETVCVCLNEPPALTTPLAWDHDEDGRHASVIGMNCREVAAHIQREAGADMAMLDPFTSTSKPR